MDHSGKSFTKLMQEPPSPTSEHPHFAQFQFGQNIPPSQFPQNIPPTQYVQIIPPSQFTQNIPPSQFMPNINPYSIPGNYQQYGSPSFQNVQHQGRSLHSAANFEAAASGSPPMAQGAGDREGSCSQRREEIEIQDSSGSSPDEGNRGARSNWSEEENIRLASAWLMHSVDSIKGNGQKGDAYWKNVAAEFNSNMPSSGRRRSSKQCKSHWAIISKPIKHFSGVYARARSTWSSGQSDDMLMDKVREMYKGEVKGNKPFAFEYLWRELKDQPKWCRIREDGDHNKRTKISESGEYTSSGNPDNQEVDTRQTRPEGQKAAKAAKLKKKGKGKDKQPSSNLEDDQFNETIARRSAALEKLAEAQKEKAKNARLNTYLNLMEKDTSHYDEDMLRRHRQLLDVLFKELFP